MQAEINGKQKGKTLDWILRWLISPKAMENIFADEEKYNVIAKITVTSSKDKDKLLKNNLWFGGK